MSKHWGWETLLWRTAWSIIDSDSSCISVRLQQGTVYIQLGFWINLRKDYLQRCEQVREPEREAETPEYQQQWKLLELKSEGQGCQDEVSESWSLKRGHMTGALRGRPQLGQEGTPPSFLLKLCWYLPSPNTARSQRAAVVPWGTGETRSGIKRSQGQTEIINMLSMLALGLSPVWAPDEKEYTLERAIRNSQCWRASSPDPVYSETIKPSSPSTGRPVGIFLSTENLSAGLIWLFSQPDLAPLLLQWAAGSPWGTPHPAHGGPSESQGQQGEDDPGKRPGRPEYQRRNKDGRLTRFFFPTMHQCKRVFWEPAVRAVHARAHGRWERSKQAQVPPSIKLPSILWAKRAVISDSLSVLHCSFRSCLKPSTSPPCTSPFKLCSPSMLLAAQLVSSPVICSLFDLRGRKEKLGSWRDSCSEDSKGQPESNKNRGEG